MADARSPYLANPPGWSETDALDMLKSARQVLGHDLVFSRDSFRTFVDALQLVEHGRV